MGRLSIPCRCSAFQFGFVKQLSIRSKSMDESTARKHTMSTQRMSLANRFSIVAGFSAEAGCSGAAGAVTPREDLRIASSETSEALEVEVEADIRPMLPPAMAVDEEACANEEIDLLDRSLILGAGRDAALGEL